MLRLTTYVGVNGLPFDATEVEAVAQFGIPIRTALSSLREQELYYPDFILRFGADTRKFRECTALRNTDVSINETPVVWDERFLDWIVSQDPEVKESVGFIISFGLGIALTGFHDGAKSEMAVHAFQQGVWDMLLSRMRPFPKIAAP